MFLIDLIQRIKWKRRGVRLSPGTFIKSGTEIGFGTRINGPLIVKGRGSCRIGRYCAFGSNIKIITLNHLMCHANIQCSLQREIMANEIDISKGDIEIGNNVWIGDSAVILSGVSIGNGAVIAAGAVVSKSIPSYSIAAGVPAKIKSLRFDSSICRQLDEISWWNWIKDKILRNNKFFNLNLSDLNPQTYIKSLIND